MSSEDAAHLRLAGVTRLSLARRDAPHDAFLFDPHRLALPCWRLALDGAGGALLVSFDRHFDTVAPPALDYPEPDAPLRTYDELARWSLSVRNYDHILAAMECGLVQDAVLVARARPRGSVEAREYVDRRGRTHRLLSVPSLERALEDAEVMERVRAGGPALLDFDLDCFTTPSDVDPTTLVPWPRELIREFVLPVGSEDFWRALLPRCRALTFALEPAHCGGVVAGHRLFADAAQVIFREMLGVDLP